jgi:hypothetical protein
MPAEVRICLLYGSILKLLAGSNVELVHLLIKAGANLKAATTQNANNAVPILLRLVAYPV